MVIFHLCVVMYYFRRIHSFLHHPFYVPLWAPKDISFYAHLKKIGFEERKMETYFIIKNLNGNQDPYVENFKNWYITMSDSDVF